MATLAARIHELKSNCTHRDLCEMMVIKGLDFNGRESKTELATRLALAEMKRSADDAEAAGNPHPDPLPEGEGGDR